MLISFLLLAYLMFALTATISIAVSLQAIGRIVAVGLGTMFAVIQVCKFVFDALTNTRRCDAL